LHSWGKRVKVKGEREKVLVLNTSKLLAKVLFALSWEKVLVKGEGKIQNLYPFPQTQFPTNAKKSILYPIPPNAFPLPPAPCPLPSKRWDIFVVGSPIGCRANFWLAMLQNIRCI
jgi:hypothetical protein